MHVDEARRIHDATILPMEQRIESSVGHFRSGLEDYIAWDETLGRFREQDLARNGWGGSFDEEERADPDTPQPNPRNVTLDGVEYQMYLKMPWEEAP